MLSTSGPVHGWKRVSTAIDFILMHAIVRKEVETMRESDKKFILAVNIYVWAFPYVIFFIQEYHIHFNV